jgi:hypothetical protein
MKTRRTNETTEDTEKEVIIEVKAVRKYKG